MIRHPHLETPSAAKAEEYWLKIRRKLQPLFVRKRAELERAERLLASEDFNAWQSDQLRPFLEEMRSRIMDPRTVGIQHDFLKKLIQVVEVLRLEGLIKARGALEAELESIRKLAEKYGGQRDR